MHAQQGLRRTCRRILQVRLRKPSTSSADQSRWETPIRINPDRILQGKPKALYTNRFTGEASILTATRHHSSDTLLLRDCSTYDACHLQSDFSIVQSQQLQAILRPHCLRGGCLNEFFARCRNRRPRYQMWTSYTTSHQSLILSEY